MIRLLILTLLLSLTPALTQAQEAAPGGFTVADLVHDCKFCSEDQKSSECIWCNGILTGTATTLGMVDNWKTFCPPQDLDTHRVRNMFRHWAKDNPDQKTAPAVEGVITAMKTIYACGRKRP